MSELALQKLEALNGLLDREYAALLGGDLRALEPLAEQKEALLSDLRDIDVDAARDLQQVTERLDRNRVMLLSAMEGIRGVVDRLRELQQLRRSLDTYTCNGQRTSLPLDRKRQLERRA